MAGGPTHVTLAQGAQYPRTNYPQAEFFNLVSNANIALGPRLRVDAPGIVTSVAPSSFSGSGATQQLIPLWTYGMALYVVRAWIIFNPADATGELQITQARFGLGTTPNNILLDLGLPTATFASPNLAMVALFERDALVHQSDMPLVNAPLDFIWSLTATNHDATNAHNYQAFGSIIFHQLQGMTT